MQRLTKISENTQDLSKIVKLLNKLVVAQNEKIKEIRQIKNKLRVTGHFSRTK